MLRAWSCDCSCTWIELRQAQYAAGLSSGVGRILDGFGPSVPILLVHGGISWVQMSGHEINWLVVFMGPSDEFFHPQRLQGVAQRCSTVVAHSQNGLTWAVAGPPTLNCG